LADEGGFRAQPALSGDDLEVHVESGRGGAVARRLVARPERLMVSLSVKSGRPDSFRLQVACLGRAPIVDMPLVPGTRTYEIPHLGANCPMTEVVLYARSWTGEPALEAVLGPIEMVRRPNAS
jgi:hypothetical protein